MKLRPSRQNGQVNRQPEWLKRMKRAGERTLDISRLAFLRETLRGLGKHNVVFIWIPKNAGTSLWTLLPGAPLYLSPARVKYRFPNRGIVTFGHMDYHQLVAGGYVSRAFDESSFKFAFVRNPFDRAVSLYFYFRRQRALPNDTSFLGFCRQLVEKGCEPVGLYNFRGFSQCNPQVRWIEKTVLDYTGYHERLDSDAAALARRLDLSMTELPRLNRSDHGHFSECYCAESEQIIAHFYAEDFRQFGYDSSLVVSENMQARHAFRAI